jgi:hypothetical protein
LRHQSEVARIRILLRHRHLILKLDVERPAFEREQLLGALRPDARDVLEKFLDRRSNDPEGLYLIGRAYAGLGDNVEAASSMQACIEAVKTAPAYKYRTEKRWLNEAQQFLKGRREAVSRR